MKRQFLILMLSWLSSLPAWAVQYTYDDLNRLTAVLYDNGSHIDYSYDAAGNLTSITKTSVAVPTPGACGSDNGTVVGSAPSANLCASGTASTVVASASSYTWSCAGENGGSTASCSAPRGYTLSATVSGANGSVSPTSQTVAYGGAGSVTLTPSVGYVPAATSTCGGSLAGNIFTTGAMTGNCTVTASFTLAPKTNQTITFATLVNKPLGTPPFAVSATASSSLPVSFASLTAGVCTVSGSTVTLVSTGTCTVRASQAGNTTYNAAPNVDRSFTVGVGTATVTLGSLSQPYTGTLKSATCATTPSGLTTSLTYSDVGSGTGRINAGNYGVACAVTQAGYTGSASGTLTITKASQTVTFANPPNKTLGDPAFAVSATASSGLPVTFSSLTTTICRTSGNTVTLVAKGTCTLRAAQAGNGNFNAAANVDRSFTVGAPVVTLGNLNQTYSGTQKSASCTTTPAGLTTRITYSNVGYGTMRTKVGRYGVNCAITQLGYTGSASGTLVIAKANQTINFPALPTSTHFAPGTSFKVSATASSGLAVKFTSLTLSVCKVTLGTTVSMVARGTCTIAANQAGNANFNAAPQVTRSTALQREMGSAGAVFGPVPSLVYGGQPGTLVATSSAGLAMNVSSLSPETCAVAGDEVTPLAAGICTVVAKPSANDDSDEAIQTITVEKADQTIAFDAPAEMTLGDALTLQANASSGLPVGYASLTPDVCAVADNRLDARAVGGCSVEARQEGDANHNPAPVLQKDIAVKPLTHALGVSLAGSGVGHVGSSPAGIDCGAVCDANFVPNSTVVLTATPEVGSDFGGWSGACSDQATTCTVEMSQDRSVTGTFNSPKASLQVVAPNGGETLRPGEPYSLTWLSSGDKGVRLELYQGTSPLLTVAAHLIGAMRFDWAVPNILAHGSDYRIRVQDEQDANLYDDSDYPFSVSRRQSGVSPSAYGNIERAYLAYTGQPGSPEGMLAWAGQLDANHGDLAIVLPAFAMSVATGMRGMSDAELTGELYLNLYGRAATRDEYTQAAGRLSDLRGSWMVAAPGDTAGAWTYALSGLTLDLFNPTLAGDAQALANKTDAAGYISEGLSGYCASVPTSGWLENAMAQVGAGQDTLVRVKGLFDEFGCK